MTHLRTSALLSAYTTATVILQDAAVFIYFINLRHPIQCAGRGEEVSETIIGMQFFWIQR